MPRVDHAYTKCATAAKISIQPTKIFTAMPASSGSRIARSPATIISTLMAIDQPVTFFATSPTVASLTFHLEVIFRLRGTIAWVRGRECQERRKRYTLHAGRLQSFSLLFPIRRRALEKVRSFLRLRYTGLAIQSRERFGRHHVIRFTSASSRVSHAGSARASSRCRASRQRRSPHSPRTVTTSDGIRLESLRVLKAG